MERDTKLGYGFLLFGAAMPYLIEAFFKSPLAALVVAILLAVLGVVFLVLGHTHQVPDRPPISKRRLILTWILGGVVIGGILYEAWRVWEQHVTEATIVAPTAKPPAIDIGVVLGADKGIGVDAIVDCENPLYQCLSEEQSKAQVLPFDLGSKNWARVIFRIKNIGETKIVNSTIHIESSQAVSLEFAAEPNPTRLPRNVLDVFSNGKDVQPYSISKGAYAVPVDITVPPRIGSFEVGIKVFGDNMPARELSIKFNVVRKRPTILQHAISSENPLELLEFNMVGGGLLVNNSDQKILVLNIVATTPSINGDDSMSNILNVELEPHRSYQVKPGAAGSFDTVVSSTDNWKDAWATATALYKACVRPVAMSPSGAGLAQVSSHYRAEGKPLPVGDAEVSIRYRIGSEIRDEKIPMKALLLKQRGCTP